MVQYVGISQMRRIVEQVGIETILRRMVDELEGDYRRWPAFECEPRLASHSKGGVIELMPTSDGEQYSFKYVNGHPENWRKGLQTVVALGLLSDVETGYPLFLSEMTILTALRTAAMSALAAKHLARPGSRRMALVGLGCQSEFQAMAFAAVLGVTDLSIYDIDPAATAKFVANMRGRGFSIEQAADAGSAVLGADIITTVTADKAHATILSGNMVGGGVHLNAVGGDCPGKTELQREIVAGANVFVELTEQTRIEGEIQQMPADFPVTELWEVIAGRKPGRGSAEEVTLFDSVGVAIEDFSALRLLRKLAQETGHHDELDLLPDPADPRDLFGVLALERAPLAAVA
ncbi:ornithine cyclodeaminase [Novosphingobium resinovorum]|uniref:ornithine cyclodeaminase n=1 Tax=Novosphingobium resinovorum TaxID=158500 RepID=UPI002ED3FB5D|nr:ornithine cyclodeaminase [Novosphingobium resinovorum]